MPAMPLVTCDRRGKGAGFSGRSLSEAPTRGKRRIGQSCAGRLGHTGSLGSIAHRGGGRSFVFSCWCRPLSGEKALKEITANKVVGAL